MEKRWKIKQAITQEQIDRFPEIHPIVLQLLMNRGLVTQEQIDEFLNPDYSQDIHDPYLFSDMDKAVERIFQALEKKEHIVVHGDYDADGVCGTALIITVLKALGADNVEVFLPHRQFEGYGLNKETIRDFIQKKVNLIITTDCGISNIEEVNLANEAGIDVIITDHHKVHENLPNAFAIIHPEISQNYPYKHLSGTGVSFKLVQALIKKAVENNIEMKFLHFGKDIDWYGFEKWLLDLVAIATVADISPLLGENRTLVKYGLIVLSKSKRVGLQELFKNAGVKFVNKNQSQTIQYLVNSSTIGFVIAPRINAAGRVDHSSAAYRLIMAEDYDEARSLAADLEQTNTQRQRITEDIFQQAIQQVGEISEEKKLIACYGRGWPLGVVGLVSGKLTDMYNLPSIVIGIDDNEARGSGRSIKEFNIIDALKKLEKYLLKYGGHAQACGFTLKDTAMLDEFIKEFQDIAYQTLKDKDISKLIEAECEIELSDIGWELVEQIECFEPFGEGNPRPKFVLKHVRIEDISMVGNNGQHLRLIVSSDKGISRKVIAFSFGEWYQRLIKGEYVDMIVEPVINEWNGNREIQLKLVDIKK